MSNNQETPITNLLFALILAANKGDADMEALAFQSIISRVRDGVTVQVGVDENGNPVMGMKEEWVLNNGSSSISFHIAVIETRMDDDFLKSDSSI